jgi:hypothetical protein
VDKDKGGEPFCSYSNVALYCTADEALCQYGKSGQARGEACQRVKNLGGKLPEINKVKSLGGAYAM